MNQKTKSSLIAGVLATVFAISLSTSWGGTEAEVKQPENRLVWANPEQFIPGSTNADGWDCDVAIKNSPMEKGQQTPVCVVLVKNTSSNTITCWVPYGQALQ